MPTRTKQPQTSHRLGRRPTPAPHGRFGRPGQPARAAHPSRPSLPGRRKPKQSTSQKALSALTGALPGSSSAKKGGGKRRAGGMALLAGGLGLAMKNRDKLPGLSGWRKDNAAAQAARPAPQPSPPTMPATTPTPDTRP
jgi:hypothetical protein